jgi:hypothetical protein
MSAFAARAPRLPRGVPSTPSAHRRSMSAALVSALVWFASPPSNRSVRRPSKAQRDALFARDFLTAWHVDALVTRAGCEALRQAGHDTAADRCAPGAELCTLGSFGVVERPGAVVVLYARDEQARALLERLAVATVVELRICGGAL